jgi:hypothetical protein
MFRCESCKVVSLPHVALTLMPTALKPVVYLDYEGLPIGKGSEILREVKLCPGCYGSPARISAGRGKADDPKVTNLASICVERLMDRTTHNSKRAKADSEQGMFWLKKFESMGGGI